MTDLLADYQRHLRDVLRREPSSVGTYLEILRRADRDLPYGLASATADELREWILTAGLARATQKLRAAAVTGFFRFACDPLEQRLDFDPTPMLPLITLRVTDPEPVDQDAVRLALARAAEPYRTWFLICSHAGLRCIELARLHREHVGPRRIRVWGKGDKIRHVPTHPLLWQVAQRLPDGPVATDRRGTALTREQISHRGNYQLKRVLDVGLAMHDLRRFFGRAAYGHRNDIEAARRLLGHASVTTTQRYIGIGAEELHDAVHALPGVA